MTNSTLIFSLPIVGSTTEDRAVFEHDDNSGWTVGRLNRADRSKFEREFSFKLEELTQAAMWGFSGDPEISKAFGGQAGKSLAAGFILMAIAIGVIKVELKT